MPEFKPRTLDEIQRQFDTERKTNELLELYRVQQEAAAAQASAAQVAAVQEPIEVAEPIAGQVIEEVFEPVVAEEQIVTEPVVAEPVVTESVIAEPVVEEKAEPVCERSEEVQEEVVPIEDVPLTPTAQKHVAAFDTLDEQPKATSPWRAFLRTLGLLLWIATLLALLLAAFGFLTRSHPISRLGNWGVYYMRSTSMQPDVNHGDLLITEALVPTQVGPGDRIVFAGTSGDAEETRLREVIEVYQADGTQSFDAIGVADPTNTREMFGSDQVLMRVIARVPGLGQFIDWLTETIWWVIGAFLLSLLLIVLTRPRRDVAYA